MNCASSGPIGKRTIPVERFAEACEQAITRQRELDLHACAGTRRIQRRRIRHFRDRGDTGDRLVEKLPSEYDTAPMSLPVDVHRAAAHAGDDPGLRQRPAFEPREDQVALRADDVFDDAEDVGLKVLDLVPSKTVRPMPTIPGRISEIGMCGVSAFGG